MPPKTRKKKEDTFWIGHPVTVDGVTVLMSCKNGKWRLSICGPTKEIQVDLGDLSDMEHVSKTMGFIKNS